MRTNENGRSMIEMLGVLAIIGVLSIGGIAGYSKAMQKFKTNKVIDQVSMIVTNIRTLYAQQTTYDGLNTETAIMMGVVPDELGTSTAETANHNPFRGAIYIGSAPLDSSTTYDSSTRGAFFVTYTGLPKETCVNISTGDWGGAYSSGLVGIAATGTDLANEAAAETLAGEAAFTKTQAQPCAGSNAAGKAIACAGATGENAAPLNVAKAARACNCGVNSPVCTVTWKYF